MGYLYVGSLLSLSALIFFVLGFGWPMLQDYIDQLPGVEAVSDYRPDLGSQLFAADGSLIAEFYKEQKRNRLVRYEDLPKHLIEALIATEDQWFFEHSGVNPVRIVESFLTNLRTSSHQGGSTITCQIAKDLLVGWEKSYERKIKEALYAMKIEQELSKEEILTIYFNQVSFGHNKAGIWAAAEDYFGKTPMELDLAESATLVALLKGNTVYSPVSHPDNSLRRRKLVLNEMVKQHFITEEERDQAGAEELKLASKAAEGAVHVNRYPYWRAYFEERLFHPKNALGGVPPTNDRIESIDDEAIYRGGLKIKTTLDPTLQAWAEESVQKALINLEKERRKDLPGAGLPDDERPRFADKIFENAKLVGKITGFVEPRWLTVELQGVKGSPVVAVPRPGPEDWRMRFKVLSPPYYVQVKALVRPEGETEHPEQDLIDRGLVSRQKLRFALLDRYEDQHAQGSIVCLEVGTGRVLAWVGGFDWDEEIVGRQKIRCIEGHQPGSSFKPLVYAEAFRRGYTPATRISNEPFTIWDNGHPWSPKNYHKDTVGGFYSIRDILLRSLNIPTVRVFETLVGQAFEFDPLTQQMTFGTARRLGIRSPIPKNLSIALGTADVTPLEMATAYSVFANGGVRVDPYAIESIETRDGRPAYMHLPDGDPNAFDPVNASLMTDILAGVIRERPGTGYTRANNFPFPIAGKTGTTNSYNDAWFTGFSKNLTTVVWIGHDRRTSLGSQMAGAKVALPPWLMFMRKAIPYHLEKYKGWTSDKVLAASGTYSSPSCPLAFAMAGKGVERVEVCKFSHLKPNAFCSTISIWVKEGEAPREVCRDCGVRYEDAPAVPTSYQQVPQEGVAQPRPIQGRRLVPLPDGSAPPPPSGWSGPEVNTGPQDNGWMPEMPPEEAADPNTPQPAVPRPVPRPGRGQL
jgi:penicillin-binding protein 1A